MEKEYTSHTELRLLQSPEYKGLGLSKRINIPDDISDKLTEPIQEFKDRMEKHLAGFDEESECQEVEIREEIKHKEFFLYEFRHNHWGANREFDMLRRDYISQRDSLKKELRSLRKERILKKISLEEKLSDLKKELSPFKVL